MPPAENPAQLLQQADSVKTSNHVEFAALIRQLSGTGMTLTREQQLSLSYLKAFQVGYAGNYDAAIRLLNTVIESSSNRTLRIRAGATAINILAISTRYQEAFSRLNLVLADLPQVSDRDARLQVMSVAAQLYIDAGQYDLASEYAAQLIKESPPGSSACKADMVNLQVLYKGQKLQSLGTEFQSGIDTCSRAGEPIFSGAIRSYMAGFYLERDRPDAAIQLLTKHYAELKATHYPAMISIFDAMLAQAYLKTGESGLAKKFALDTISGGIKNEYGEPLTAAYRVLYLVEQKQGDMAQALAYHEKYMAADKGYLNNISAKAIAYQKVKQQVLAKKLQVDTLAKQNKILQLQQALSKKAVEAGRLWIILLILLLAFVGFITYRVKRSQLRFMKLARRDGLTGIFNRQHFVNEAERQLQYCSKSKRDVCLVLVDLDHFKAVNDTHGHAVGDKVLKRAVAACQAHLRSTDLFGRLGGEEFGIVLPECALDQVLARVDQMRLAVAAASSGEDGLGIPVSASFGVATVANSGYELRQLMSDADNALYQAKREGRNRVSLSQSRRVEMCLV
ncbi:MAG: GGDEF domain-containing protein [Rhodanobacter sp.]